DDPFNPPISRRLPSVETELVVYPIDAVRTATLGLRSEGIDAAVQRTLPALASMAPPIRSFEGLSNEDNAMLLKFRVLPPDTNGDVSSQFYVQLLNLASQVFDIGWLPLAPVSTLVSP